MRFSRILIGLLCLATIIAAPFHYHAFPAAGVFIPAFVGTTGTADALSAVLLLSLYRIDGSRALLATGAAYLIDALLIGPYGIMFPNVIDAHGFIGNEQSSAWLWVVWHITFAVMIIAGLRGKQQVYDQQLRQRHIGASITGCFVFAALAVVAVTVARDMLPPLVLHGSFRPLYAGLSVFASVSDVAVIAVLWRREKYPSLFSIWLIVALAASALDTGLNAVSAVRFSAAWYVGKAETFVSASIVLVSLLAAWSALYARATALAQRLAHTVAAGRALQERLTREHEIAAALQQASLPNQLPQIDGIALHATYRPAASDLKIGGDWYDAFMLADGRLAITIGDVAGHGLAASVIMSKLRQSLRLAAQLVPDPNKMLTIADSALRSEHPDTIATAFVALLELDSGILTWACAGHPPPMIRLPDGSIRQLHRPAPPLGLYGAVAVATSIERLEPMSILVAYTDGLIESSKDIIGGLAELQRVLADVEFESAHDPAVTVFERIVGTNARDDVAVIALSFSGIRVPRGEPLYEVAPAPVA